MDAQEQQLPQPPRPEPALENRPYWGALTEHRLVLQRCTGCQRIRHYPRPVCDACFSMAYDWAEASGRGTVHTWAITHHPFHPGFKRQVPYTTVTVDLEEGVRLQAPFRGDSALLKIGLAVVVDYEDVDANLTLPCFRLA